MVKKKTRRKIVKPPQPKLETVFNCCKCGQKKTVAVKFNRREKTGHLRCKSCGVEYDTKIRSCDAYIDVYYRWVDEIQKERDKSSEEESEENEKKQKKRGNEEKEYKEEEARDSESEKNKSMDEDNEEENEEENEEKKESDGEKEENEEKEEKEEKDEEDEE